MKINRIKQTKRVNFDKTFESTIMSSSRIEDIWGPVARVFRIRQEGFLRCQTPTSTVSGKKGDLYDKY
jgi:hypothetical protein